MRTAVADFNLKNHILIARDNHRHALEDHGLNSVEERGCREILRGALQLGWAGGLTVEDVHRITGDYTHAQTHQALIQAIEEEAVLEGTVLTSWDIPTFKEDEKPAAIKPRRNSRRNTKAIEATE